MDISDSGYWMINKLWVKRFGLKETLFIQHLLDIKKILKDQNLILEDDSFFFQQERIKEDLGFSISTQLTIINFFKSLQILEVNKKGLPAKNYYKINISKLEEEIKNG